MEKGLKYTIIILIIVVLLAAIGGFYYYRNKKGGLVEMPGTGLPINSESPVCIQVITPAKNSTSGECKEFPTPCDVLEGWQKVDKCEIGEVKG